jgi:DNA invertase Pin-like site-specific DNA recombinase
MAVVGYRRVSTSDQSTDNQDLGQVDKLFEDVATGSKANRPGLQAMLEYVRAGDTVVVLAIDRMARSTLDLITIIEGLRSKGVSVRFIRDRIRIRAGAEASPADELLVTMLAAIGQFERQVMLARQKEGIARAKREDADKPREERRYKGKPKTIDRDEVKRILAEQGGSKARTAKKLGISRTSVYNILWEEGGKG